MENARQRSRSRAPSDEIDNEVWTKTENTKRALVCNLIDMHTCRIRGCNRTKGNCPYHATEKKRCKSTVEWNPARRCQLQKSEDADYCQHHAQYPDLANNLQTFVDQIGDATFALNYKKKPIS